MFVNVKEVYGAGLMDLWKLITRNQEINQEKFVDNKKKEIRIIPLIMQKISWCESRDRQFNRDGTIFRGAINKLDVGKYQINEYYHLENSIKIGMDIYTEQGNEDYAMYLYKNQGTKPWNWSSGCWNNDLTLEELKLKYK